MQIKKNTSFYSSRSIFKYIISIVYILFIHHLNCYQLHIYIIYIFICYISVILYITYVSSMHNISQVLINYKVFVFLQKSALCDAYFLYHAIIIFHCKFPPRPLFSACIITAVNFFLILSTY